MYDVFADNVTQRIDMLLTNGITGLVLVLAALYLFLNGRIAFWVAAGIPISILAALGCMYLMGVTLNMISMFAIIMGSMAVSVCAAGHPARSPGVVRAPWTS